MSDMNGHATPKRSHEEAFGPGRAALATLYKETDVSKGRLRLLSLQGGTSTTLRGNLILREDALLQDGSEPPYIALSYTWGNRVKSGNIEILSGSQAHDLPITPNLEAALKQLRYEASPRARLLWIDAICINQADNNERNAQVRRMGKIFSEAEKVIVWLGEEEANSGKALQFISRILDLENVSSMSQDIRCVEDWAALFQLLRRNWFGRRWVIQEIALARNASVQCGKDKVSWDNFAFAVSLFASKHTELRELFKKSEKYGHNAEYLGDVNELGAVRLIHVANNLFRRSDDRGVLDFLLTLETLVSMLPSFEASKAQDTIFAVLSLAADVGKSKTLSSPGDNDTQPDVDPPTDGEQHDSLTAEQKKKASLVFKKMRQQKDESTYLVDYGQSFYEVCKYFLNWTTRRSESLDIICRPWAPTKTPEDLPSWIPTLAGLAFRSDGKGISRRVRADSLVGMPGWKRNYNASRAYPGKWDFGTGAKDKVLSVNGFVLDTIGVKKLPAQSGNIPFEWLVAGGWTNTQELPPDPFWRTLVADRGPDQQNPPTYYSLACKHAYAMGVEGDDLKTDRYEGCPDIVAEFLKRAQSVVWYRCLIVTKENRILGLVPYDANPTDLICILYRCSVPVVLRKCKDELTGSEYHQFIGECYIHSMMDGSAFRLRDKKLEDAQRLDPSIKHLNETFHLR